MKKYLLAYVLFVLCLSAAVAMGEVNVVAENFYAFDTYGAYGHWFARVENAGDEPVEIEGTFEVFDENGELLSLSDEFSSESTNYLNPGEYTYLSSTRKVRAGTEAVKTYSFSVSENRMEYMKIARLGSEAEYEIEEIEDIFTERYINVTIFNSTEFPIYEMEITVALIDAEGNLLEVECDSVYDDAGLQSGDSTTVCMELDGEVIEYCESIGMTPVSADAVVYAIIE